MFSADDSIMNCGQQILADGPRSWLIAADLVLNVLEQAWPKCPSITQGFAASVLRFQIAGLPVALLEELQLSLEDSKMATFPL
jgi:hypothetical protein